MGARNHHDHQFDNDFSFGEDHESIRHRKYIKRKLDAKREMDFLRKELEDYEGELDEFDWSNIDLNKE